MYPGSVSQAEKELGIPIAKQMGLMLALGERKKKMIPEK